MPERPPVALTRALTGVAIALGAFLLFGVEPLISKAILPWYGGSAAVWTTCLLFFQVALLLGYGYAHALTRLPPGRQTGIHLALIALALSRLPVAPDPRWRPHGGEDPTFAILALLTTSIGIPFVVLAATSPLLQAWFARATDRPFPYRFFALSNLGSLLALLAYPFVVERHLTIGEQEAWWSIAFVLYAAVAGTLAWRVRRAAPAVVAGATVPAPAPGRGEPALWVALSAAGSVLLLATTAHLTQNVAAIPLLWVAPLALYLLSFVATFESDRWYRPAIAVPLLAVALALGAYAMGEDTTLDDVRILVPLYCVLLFLGCLVCHGEIARRRPAARFATAYYLWISVGGAIGGLLEALVAPRALVAIVDLPIAMVLVVAVALVARVPLVRRGGAGRIAWVAAAAGSLALTAFLVQQQRDALAGARLLVRDFYGALRVADFPDDDVSPAFRQLAHGTIVHGEEFLDPRRRLTPTTYYGPNSGIGRALASAHARTHAIRVGSIGLGAGTLAGYGRTGDALTIYEIDPLVERIAREQFGFLSGSPAHVDVVLGDARRSLETEPPRGYDVLSVDAFSGDAIPVHLLTREALALYERHLAPDGLLAVHVSNRYLDLVPVVARAARDAGRAAIVVRDEDDDKRQIFPSDWVLVASPARLADPLLARGATAARVRDDLRPWTDDYSDVWAVVKSDS